VEFLVENYQENKIIYNRRIKPGSDTMYMDKKQKSSPTKDNVGAFFQTCKVCVIRVSCKGSKIMGNYF
jgi:hypothetical protein